MAQKYVVAYGYATKAQKYLDGFARQRPTYTTELEEALLIDDATLLDMAKRNLISGAMTVYKAKVKIDLDVDGARAGYRRPATKTAMAKKSVTVAKRKAAKAK